MKCPKCGNEKTFTHHAYNAYVYCHSCQGYWTEWQQEELDRLKAENKLLRQGLKKLRISTDLDNIYQIAAETLKAAERINNEMS